MHGWREQLDSASIRLPSQAEIHEVGDDGWLNVANPRARHFLDNRPDRVGRSGTNAKSVDEHLLRISARSLIKALIAKTARRMRRLLPA